MLRQFKKLPGILFLALLPLAGIQAEIYQCMDAKGRLSFQDRACQDRISAAPSLARHGSKEIGKHFIWKANSGSKTVYLFGSIHFGSAAMYPLPRPIMTAFEASDALVVEANSLEADSAKSQEALANNGFYADGAGLKDHITLETWENVSQMAAKLDLPLESIANQKPWLASFTLTGHALRQAGFSSEYGIDHFFIQRAQAKKPIIALESVSQQLELLDSFSPMEQEKLLRQTVADLEKGIDYFKAMLTAWKQGDAQAIDVITRGGFDASGEGRQLYKALFADRNAAMMEKLEALLADGKTYFVVVGAGHLVGERGLIELFKAKGFAISQL